MSFGIPNLKSSAELRKEQLEEARKGNGQALEQLLKELVTILRSGDQQQTREVIALANEMAITADPKLVNALYNKLLPCLEQSSNRELYYPYLVRWARLYDGSILVATYPNFKGFAEKKVPAEQLDQPLPRNLEFERNLKNRNDKVQFFEDSYISETDDLNGSRITADQILYDIAEVEAIKEKLTQGEPSPQKLQQYQHKVAMFNRLHDSAQSDKLRVSLGASGVRVGNRLDQSLEWCKHYLQNYPRLLNRQISFGEFREQLSVQPEQFMPVEIKPMEFTLINQSKPQLPKQKIMNEVITTAQERSPIAPPMSRQIMTESKQQGIHLTIHSSKKNISSSLPVGNDVNIQSPGNQQSAHLNFFKKGAPGSSSEQLFRSEAVVNKYSSPPGKANHQEAENTPETVMLHQQDFVLEVGKVCNRNYKLNLDGVKPMPVAQSEFQSADRYFPPQNAVIPERFDESMHKSAESSGVSPELVVTKYKPQLISSQKRIHTEERSHPRQIARSPFGDTQRQQTDRFRLSDFTNQKQRRKQVAEMGPINHTPQWLISTFSDKFNSEELFSRFRRNCLHNRSHLYKDNDIEVICTIIQEGCRSLHLRITFRNKCGEPKEIKCTYNISKSFQVTDATNVKSKFILTAQTEHSFHLEIMEFPLGVCSVELKLQQHRSEVLLPVTLTRFVTLEYLDREEWFVKWNQSNSHRYYTSRRVVYTKKVLTVSEMTFLFPECTELGRKESYSFDEFGCVGKYEYFGLQFLLVFAFNVDSLLTIEALCLKEMKEEQREFLDYYLDTLTMLIERVDLEG